MAVETDDALNALAATAVSPEVAAPSTGAGRAADPLAQGTPRPEASLADTQAAAGCLDEQTVLAFIAGRIVGDHVDNHLATCPACCDLVVHAARASLAAGTPPKRELPPSIVATMRERPRRKDDRAPSVANESTFGRYQVRSVLGAGGMGLVYRAHDPDLGRAIALKVVKPSGHGDDVSARARFVREAQAMARIGHPNVITVHDVGTIENQMFVAMELVDGEDLGAWEMREGRTWRDIVATYLQAARGLAAAHDAGLVHRDFKPANVLVGNDGRVRVLDFGLARTSEDETPDPDAPVGALTNDQGLTQTGSILGTPRFMAPEQHHGEIADARTDQYAFCVALYQALYHQFPHEGATYAALSLAVTDTDAAPPPRKGALPIAIERVLMRGLARKRTGRFPSMHDLIAALEPTLTRRRRWPYVAAVGAIAVAAVGMSIYLRAPAPSVSRADLFARNQGELGTAGAKSAEWPELSPDGTSLAYISEAGVEIQTLATGATRLLLPTSELLFGVRWSPDGNHLLAATASGPAILSLSGPRRSFNGPGEQCITTWRPPGDKVLWYCQTSHTYVLYDVATGAAQNQKLDVPAGFAVSLDWSTRGLVVVVRSYAEGVSTDTMYVTQPDGTGSRVVVIESSGIGQARWNARGDRINYSRANNGLEILTIDPFAREPSSTPLFLETGADGFASGFTISSDETSLYAGVVTNVRDVSVLDTATGKIDLLTTDGTNKRGLAVSPDSSTVAFSHGSNNRRIYLAPITGGVPTDIGIPESNVRDLAFSPDGNELAYTSVETQKPTLRVINLATKQLRELAMPDAGAFFLAWTTRGIHVVGSDYKSMFTVDPRTGAASVYWKVPNTDQSSLPYVALNRDGSLLALMAVVNEIPGLASTNGTELTTIVNFATGFVVDWSGDGKWLYQRTQPMTSEPYQRITAHPVGNDGPARFLGTMDMSEEVRVTPDGSRVVWLTTQRKYKLLRATTSALPPPPKGPPVRRPARAAPPYLPMATNLELTGAVGQIPSGWEAESRASISDSCGRPGTCVSVDGGAKQLLTQRFDATPYRGRRVRLAFEARVEGPDSVRFGLNSGLADGAELASGRLPVTAQGWKAGSVVAEIEPDATYVEIVINSRGKARVWLGAMTLSVLTP